MDKLYPGTITVPRPGYYLLIDFLLMLDTKVDRMVLYILWSLNGILNSSRAWSVLRLNFFLILFIIASANPACPLPDLKLAIMVLPTIS